MSSVISRPQMCRTSSQIAKSGSGKAIRREGDKRPRHGNVRLIVHNGTPVKPLT